MTEDQRHYVGVDLSVAYEEAHAEAQPVIFGFWVFLMSDLVLFAILMTTYSAMAIRQAGGPGPRDLFDLRDAFIETIVLLSSSFTFGMASLGVKYRDANRVVIAWLAATVLLGGGFVALELGDFATLAAKGGIPARSGFLSAFYTLISTHLLHVCAGMVWIVVIIAQRLVMASDVRVATRLMRLGLFWHMIDVVWVGIFTIVYLFGLTA